MSIDIDAIVNSVKRQFGDESGVQLVNSDVIAWINQGVNEAYMQSDNLKQKAATVDSVVDQESYSLPLDCLEVQAIEHLDSGSYYKLEIVTKQFLDENIEGWSGQQFNSGIPRYAVRGLNDGEFLVFPAPESAVVDAFRIIYSRYPVAIVDELGTVDLPDYYASYLLEYCLMKAYEMDEEWEVADRKAAYVQSTLDFNNGRGSWFGRQTYPTIVTTSEDYR